MELCAKGTPSILCKQPSTAPLLLLLLLHILLLEKGEGATIIPSR